MKAKLISKRKSLVTLLILALLAFTLTQCMVTSFYPLYTQKELVKDDRIIGTWMSKRIDEDISKDSLVWEIGFDNKSWLEKTTNIKYFLKVYPYNNPSDNAKFDIHVVELDNELYLDFLLEDFTWETDVDFAVFHILPLHTFAKLDIKDTITIKWLDGDFLESMLDENKIRIKHEKRKDGSLLTAKPKELQKFIIKYNSHPKAYSDKLGFDLTPMSKES